MGSHVEPSHSPDRSQKSPWDWTQPSRVTASLQHSCHTRRMCALVRDWNLDVDGFKWSQLQLLCLSLYPFYCPLEFFSFFSSPFCFSLCLECMTHIVSPHLLSIQILHHSAFSGNLCLIFQVGVTCYMPTLCFFFFSLKSKHRFIFVYFCYMIIWRIFIFSTRLQAPWGEEQFLSWLYTKHLKQCLAPRMSSINSCCLDTYTWSSCATNSVRLPMSANSVRLPMSAYFS